MNLLGDICNFFDTGKTSFDPKDTIEVMRIRDAVIEGKDVYKRQARERRL